MNLERHTASALKCGSITGIIIATVGLFMHFADLAHSTAMMTAGIAAVVFTPFAGMVVSFAALSVNRERRYALSALALVTVTVAGMAAAFLL